MQDLAENEKYSQKLILDNKLCQMTLDSCLNYMENNFWGSTEGKILLGFFGLSVGFMIGANLK